MNGRMNRHQRRAAAATSKTFAALALEWPTISADCIGERRGEVVFAVCQHDALCPTLNGGGGLLACRCTPTVSYHQAPTIQ